MSESGNQLKNSGISQEKEFMGLLFRHHRWANMQIIGACLKLTDEQMAKTVPGTYGSIRATILHLVRSEIRYLKLISPDGVSGNTDPDLSTPLEELLHLVDQSGSRFHQLLAHISPVTRVQVGKAENPEMIPAYIVLLQVIYHAHEHHAQINSMLGTFGLSTKDVSGWSFYDEEIIPGGLKPGGLK